MVTNTVQKCYYEIFSFDYLILKKKIIGQHYRQFFDVCDGIFLNYTWNEDSLIRSREAAGERKFDVWVGLDVFGRNFYEGGKFNTYKVVLSS